MILNYIKHEVRSNTVEVSWVEIEMDTEGVPVREAQVKCRNYSEGNKDDFLAEVEGAVGYLPILGWS
jgi:hypothetical protein